MLLETIEFDYNTTLEIHQDEDPMDPFDGDFMPPMLIDYGGRNGVERDGYDGKYDLRDPLAYLSDYQIMKEWDSIVSGIEIRSFFGTHLATFKSGKDCDEYLRNEEYPDSGLTIREMRREFLVEYIGNLRGNDQYDLLAQLWNIAGYAAVISCICGYSQGDYADVLAVYHPDWLKVSGAPNDDQKQAKTDLEKSVKYYGSYTFGDCYGFVLNDDNGEEIVSCWGFIGDADKEYMMQQAKEAAQSWVREQ